MTTRSPNLTPARVDAIVGIIRRWTGRLTWIDLIKAVAEETRATYTRQALFKHESIRIAYEIYRESGIDAGVDRPISAALKASIDRVKRLETENAELRKKETILMEQFIRWAYNASTRGLTEEFLNQALPPTNRQGNRILRN